MTTFQKIAGILFLLTGLSSAWAQQLERPQSTQRLSPGEGIETRIDINGNVFHCNRYGQGGPTVVLINGMGRDQSYWQCIVPEIAAFTSVFTYDPLNIGQSDKGPYPPKGAEAVQTLKMLLEKTDMPRPYILLAHSFGSMAARLFAATYPNATAGLILEDATPVGLNKAMLDVVTGPNLEALKRFASHTPPAMQETEKAVAESRLPRIPLVVLNAAERNSMRRFTPENRARCHAVEDSLGRALADLIPGGREIRVQGAGHAIHVDRPRVVIDVVKEMVQDIQSGKNALIAPGTLQIPRADLQEVDGRPAYVIDEARGERLIWAEDVQFRNGVIEADIKAEGKYVGLGFRVHSGQHYEAVYFRPRNVNSNDAMKARRAVQYIAHPGYDWFYLRDRYTDQYEAAAAFTPGQWFHVKLVLRDSLIQVFVDGNETPCLSVKSLNTPLPGGVGLWAGNTSTATVANIRIKDDGDAVAASPERPELAFLWDSFKNRRSVRRFKSDPVPEADLLRILDMARTAPTSGNQQPWKFLVIRDREKLNTLRDACVARRMATARARGMTDAKALAAFKAAREKYFSDFLTAPVYVVVMTDTLSRYPSYNIYDGSLAGGYLMLAARALGYGTVFSQDSVPWEVLQEVFEIPGHYQRICFTPIGVPETWPEPQGKKPLSSFIVWDQFVPGWNYLPPVTRTAITLSSDLMASYAGRYDFGEGTVLTLTRHGEGLHASFNDRAPSLFYAEAEDHFFMKTANVQITFNRDKGQIKGLTFIQSGQNYSATTMK